jgi:SAM-dependent methyltransferase
VEWGGQGALATQSFGFRPARSRHIYIGLKFPNNMTKKHFADFYDEISSRFDAKIRADKVLKYVGKYSPKAKNILELGTGNGKVLSFFPKKFNLFGLDVEENYLKLAKKKVPSAKLWKSSMHDFKSKEKFDVIFSVFDSINFLKNFDQWKQTFQTVNKDLSDDGLFIFDCYTPQVLKENKNASISFWEEKFGFASNKRVVKTDRLIWHFRIFEKKKNDIYELHNFLFKERIFPIAKVELELKKHFTILEKRDWETLSHPTSKSLRVLFVARKT